MCVHTTFIRKKDTNCSEACLEILGKNVLRPYGHLKTHRMVSVPNTREDKQICHEIFSICEFVQIFGKNGLQLLQKG